jgi:hypothetical protein
MVLKLHMVTQFDSDSWLATEVISDLVEMDDIHVYEFCVKYCFKLTKIIIKVQNFDIMCDRFSREQYDIFKL